MIHVTNIDREGLDLILIHVPGAEGATGHVGENLEGGPVGEEVEGVAEEDRLRVRDGVNPRHVAEDFGLLLDHTCQNILHIIKTY